MRAAPLCYYYFKLFSFFAFLTPLMIALAPSPYLASLCIYGVVEPVLSYLDLLSTLLVH